MIVQIASAVHEKVELSSAGGRDDRWGYSYEDVLAFSKAVAVGQSQLVASNDHAAVGRSSRSHTRFKAVCNPSVFRLLDIVVAQEDADLLRAEWRAKDGVHGMAQCQEHRACGTEADMFFLVVLDYDAKSAAVVHRLSENLYEMAYDGLSGIVDDDL